MTTDHRLHETSPKDETASGIANANLKISELAEAADVGVETIRYYENEKIIRQPMRPEHGHRLYPSTYVGRIRFVKCAQSLGFNLQEIKQWLHLLDSSTESFELQIESMNSLLDKKMTELAQLRDALALKIDILRSLQSLVQKSDNHQTKTLASLLGLFQIYTKSTLRGD